MMRCLSRNRPLAALLAAAYSVLVIAGHGAASVIADRVTEALTRQVVNAVISGLLLAGLALTALALRRHLAAIRRARFGLLFALVTPLLAIGAYHTLLVTNIEGIHFLQYALLALPLFALNGSYGATVLWAGLVGVVDEAWQYLWIYGHRTDVYFDFNDIILNLVGAGFGVTLLYLAAAVRGERAVVLPAKTVSRVPGMLLPALCAAALALAITTGLVQVYPAAAADGQSWLLSRAAAPQSYWTQLPWGKTYHVLHPFEGLLLAQLLLWFYGLLDRDTLGTLSRVSRECPKAGQSEPQ